MRPSSTPANHTVIISGGHGSAFSIPRGSSFRIINTHGTQVVDTWALNSSDTTEYLSVEHSRRMVNGLFVHQGDAFYTNRRNKILTVTQDTWGGDHDMLCAACDQWLYKYYGCHDYHRNCADNYRVALSDLRIEISFVPNPVNLWMRVSPDPGNLELQKPTSQPGDFIVMKAEMDLILVLSACPMDLDGINVNGGDGTSKQISFSLLD